MGHTRNATKVFLWVQKGLWEQLHVAGGITF